MNELISWDVSEELYNFWERGDDGGPVAVWPDWAIFESSWLQIFFQKAQMYCVFLGSFDNHNFLSKFSYGLFLGNFWNHLGKILISASGHTGLLIKEMRRPWDIWTFSMLTKSFRLKINLREAVFLTKISQQII